MAETNAQPELILLDIYGTILDMSEMQRKINALVDNRSGYFTWLKHMTQYFLNEGSNEIDCDFETVALTSLKNITTEFNKSASDVDLHEIINLLKHLPLKEDVQEGLSQLSDIDIRIGALTNVSERIINERMARTGLVSYFEKILTAEKFGKYKPDVEIYLWAAKCFGLRPESVMLVSTHGWDIAGASAAGMRTVYIRQPRQIIDARAEQSDFIIESMPELIGIFDVRGSKVVNS